MDGAKGKLKDLEIIIDKNKNPILFVSFNVKAEGFSYKMNMNFFMYNNRMFFMIGECGLSNRCKSLKSEMDLVISKFVNFNNIEKINVNNGKFYWIPLAE